MRLPEPTKVNIAAGEADWHSIDGRVFGYVNADGLPFVDAEGCHEGADRADAYAARVLAATRWAREQADEHNTATQDHDEAEYDGPEDRDHNSEPATRHGDRG